MYQAFSPSHRVTRSNHYGFMFPKLVTVLFVLFVLFYLRISSYAYFRSVDQLYIFILVRFLNYLLTQIQKLNHQVPVVLR